VDLDQQAVEVTKLSLLLKVLEGETEQTVGQLQFARERVLPDLGQNIKCGNSLIGPDFYDSPEADKLSDEEFYRVNAFDWEGEFPKVMHAGGFDAVIGNPPYLNLKRGFLSDAEKHYFNQNFTTAAGQYDAFALFIERAISLLVLGGLHSFIVPKPLLASESYEPVRDVLLQHHLVVVADSGAPFEDAAVESTVIVVQKRTSDSHNVRLERVGRNGVVVLGTLPEQHFATVPFKNLSYLLNTSNAGITEKLSRQGTPLRSLTTLFSRGIEAGKKAGAIRTVPYNGCRPLLRGEDVTRYTINYADIYYDPGAADRTEWKDERLYEQPEKLIIRRVANSIIATLDTCSFWTLNTLYTLVPAPRIDSRYLLGCLNSKLLSYYFWVVFLSDDKLFPYVRISQLEQLPICAIDFADRADKVRHDQIAQLVERMLDLQKRLPSARTSNDKTVIQRQIDATDKQIDRLVYDLYGLTEDEVRPYVLIWGETDQTNEIRFKQGARSIPDG
jgi:adenine-specific DNA-methyltransferase